MADIWRINLIFGILIFGLAQLCLTEDMILTKEKARSNSQRAGGRIIGGKVMIPHSIKFITYVSILNNMNWNLACGGSLISMRHVLTAGHCLHQNKVEYVKLGAHNISAKEREQMKVYPEIWATHEKYNPRTLLNDIGMIKLSQDIIPNRYINIIKLEATSDASKYYVGKHSASYGWGLIADKPRQVVADVLHGVQLDIMSNSECLSLAPQKNIYKGDICTSGARVVGTCFGDSGGPLVLKKKQIGITSRGVTADCSMSEPSVYTRVANYRQWIDEKIISM